MAELFSTRIEDGGGNISLSEYLTRVGGTRFSETDDKGFSPYWSSMESRSSDGKFAASAYFTKNDGVGYLKDIPHKVRAIKYIHIY